MRALEGEIIRRTGSHHLWLLGATFSLLFTPWTVRTFSGLGV